jgi:ABC-2 type transport system permease protein
MRGWRAFAVLTSVLLLLGGASYGLYRIVLTTSRYSSTPLSPQIGQALFLGLAFLELMMVCFVTPAVTAGAVSGEQEKQTYEMLLATPLRPGAILRGKLIASLGYVFLLILAAVPMASVVFVFGGVAPKELLKALIIVICLAVTLGVVGVFASAWLGRTTRATVASYLFVLALLVLPYVAYILSGVINQREPPRWLLVPSPVSALASAVAPANQGVGPSGVLGQLGWVLGGGLSLASSSMPVGGAARPVYHYTLALYGGLSLLLYLLTVRLVRPTRRWRMRWKEVAGAALLVLLFAGLVAGAFLVTARRYPSGGLSRATAPTPAPLTVPRAVEVRVEEREVAPVATPTPVLAEEAEVSSQSLSVGDRVAIYAAVVRQLYCVDHTSDVAPEWEAVYLVEVTDDSVGGDPNLARGEAMVLPDTLRAELVAQLAADMPAAFTWVSAREEAPLDDQGSVEGNGVVITLGNIHVGGDGSVLVAGSLYFASLGARGRTYVVSQIEDCWQVTGDTGVQWSS